MRDEKQQLSALIAGIYDAALSPSLWPDAMRDSAAFVGGMGASVYFKGAGNSSGYPVHVFGIEPHHQHLYFDRYAKLDPTLIGFYFAEIGAPTAVADVMSYDEFLETRFYREWVQPQGMVDSANVVLDRSATSAACFVVFRHERDGIVDDNARRRMRLIVPHVRRAALVGGIIDAGKVEAETFSAILDGLSSGMFLVDADARMVHANVAGHAMLAGGGPFCVVDGRLVAPIRGPMRPCARCSPPRLRATPRSASRVSPFN
jgi:hypothetical protein